MLFLGDPGPSGQGRGEVAEAFLCIKCDDVHQNNREGLTFKTRADTHSDMHVADTTRRNAATSSSAASPAARLT